MFKITWKKLHSNCFFLDFWNQFETKHIKIFLHYVSYWSALRVDEYTESWAWNWTTPVKNTNWNLKIYSFRLNISLLQSVYWLQVDEEIKLVPRSIHRWRRWSSAGWRHEPREVTSAFWKQTTAARHERNDSGLFFCIVVFILISIRQVNLLHININKRLPKTKDEAMNESGFHVRIFHYILSLVFWSHR